MRMVAMFTVAALIQGIPVTENTVTQHYHGAGSVHKPSRIDINSKCPLPHWDHATMDSLSRRYFYRINNTDIASVPWVHGDNSSIYNVPTVKCDPHAKGDMRHRVVVVLVDAIHRPLFETKYPRTMSFGRQSHEVFNFKHHHTQGFNSPPNKNAIFAGSTGVKNTATHAPKWLHQTFKQHGYSTIHADDVCAPDDVVGSLTSLMRTKPGDIMPDSHAICMPCVDPDPSCSAPSSLEFVAQAVEQHSQCNLFVTVNPNQEHSMRWWYSQADLWILRFLERVVDHDTIAVILSDHGLHYGPASITPMGAAYRTNPFLSILWPKRMKGAELKALQRSTSASLTTHLNVYAFLDAIASGTDHSNASLASPNFALNQTCEEALIPSTECRCMLAGSCTPAAKKTAIMLLKAQLRVVSAHPYCMPLNESMFSIQSCTGVETAHTASLTRDVARQTRVYRLTWDSKDDGVTTLVQQTRWASDVAPCRSLVPSYIWPLCICTADSVKVASAAKATVKPSRARNLTLSVVGMTSLLLCIGCGLATRAGWVKWGSLVGTSDGSLNGVPLLALGVSVLSTFMATLQSIVVEFSKVNGRVEYDASSAVFYTELLKLVVSITLWRLCLPRAPAARPRKASLWPSSACPPSSAAVSGVASLMSYAMPAMLYLVQNNLTIRAMGLLDPPTFQLWVSFRLLPAALLTRFVLKRSVSLVQWIALILLMLGMAVTTLKQGRRVDSSMSSADNECRGILLVLLNGCLSATSGVINEWLLKYQDASLPMTLKNARVYAFGVVLAIPTIRIPFTSGALYGFSPSAWAVVCTNAALGLSVSLVLRYADNLIKNFTGAAAVLLSALVSGPLFGFQWTYPFLIGALIVCCSFVLYFHLGVRVVADDRKVKQQDEAQGLLASTEAPPFNTVITFGTFDVLHHGHVRILQRAAAYGRRLVVGLSTDELNMSKKQRRPVYPYDQRKAILEAISCVDMVFAEESLEKKESYCRQHGADVLVMGDDWVGKFDAVGIEVRYLERTPAVSTTQTIELCTMLHGQKQSGRRLDGL